MKICNGFVSNSSSSSFVIGLPKNKTKINIVLELDIKKYADGKISTIEDLISFYGERFGEREYWGKAEKEEYKTARKCIEEGGIIVHGLFSDQEGDRNPLSAFLCWNGIKEDILSKEDKDVIVLSSEGGY